METPTRKRKADKGHRNSIFTPGEIEKLKSEVEARKSILFGSFSSTLTKARNNLAWKSVTSEINKVGSKNRQVEQVKRKWENLKSDVKGKPKMRKTGGGEAESKLPTSDENRMMGIIGTSSIRGISGGIDTSMSGESRYS